MTRLSRAKPSEEPSDRAHPPERMLVDYFARTSVRRRCRIAELRRFFNETSDRIRFTERGLLEATVMVDHLAEFVDGAQRIDDFLGNETEFDAATRARLKDAALAGPIVIYRADELGRILGLTWEVRTRLKITTFDAIDAPSGDERAALRRAQDAAAKRAKRAAQADLPKALTAGKRKTAELLKRRRLAIREVVAPAVEGMSVGALCEMLQRRQKNGPFHGISASSLPKLVRLAIEGDPSLETEVRAVAGRPDRRPSMWVALRDDPTTSSKVTAMKVEKRVPTNEEEYRAHIAARLAEFTPATAAKELPDWFNSAAEKALREACGITDRKEFLAMANEVRNRLLAVEWDTDEG